MNATWFHDNGVGVFPVRHGTKIPTVAWPTYICTRDQTAGFRSYGVRLGSLGVIDPDMGSQGGARSKLALVVLERREMAGRAIASHLPEHHER
jgi:hypothetical protein